MKMLAFFLLLLPMAAADRPRLTQVQSVYLLPMSNSLDQYLANRLNGLGLFQIVTDPKKADALLTDRLGEAFEKRLDELYPPPETEKEEDKDKDNAKDPALQDAGAKASRISSVGRSKGTIFLVDRKSRDVVWSIYQRPKNYSADELNRTADRIAQHLKRDFAGK